MLANNHNTIGKVVAGAVMMLITVLPFFAIVISDYSLNESNGQNTIYTQQAFDASASTNSLPLLK